MTHLQQLDIFDALARRDAGAASAAATADAEKPGWSDAALALVREYARANFTFMAEDVRVWAHEQRGLAEPPDGRAWGQIMLRAARTGLLERAGYDRQKSRHCHGAPKTVWRSTVYARAA